MCRRQQTQVREQWGCDFFQPEKEIINVEPPTMLDENKLVADADEHCSHAAPTSGGKSSSKVAHLVVGKLALMLKKEELHSSSRIRCLSWASLTTFTRPTPSDKCVEILTAAMSSTHRLKDFSSIWALAFTFGVVLSKQSRGSRYVF